MKSTILGIKDYIKDCWHDFWFCIWDNLDNFVSIRLHRTYCWKHNDGCFTKEGDLKYYIQQRKKSEQIKRYKNVF